MTTRTREFPRVNPDFSRRRRGRGIVLLLVLLFSWGLVLGFLLGLCVNSTPPPPGAVHPAISM